MIKLLSRAEAYAEGRKLRRTTPREAHAEAPDGARDPAAILAEGDADRVKELIPIRYQRMTQDSFAFLRGAAAVMAADLARHPASGVSVQASGDCHLMNFGALVTPEDDILFDINDFDETLPNVDFTVDVKRLAASAAVAALAAGLSKRKARALARDTVEAYRRHIFLLCSLSPLAIWHSRIELEGRIKGMESRSLRRRLRSLVEKARGRLNEDDNFPHLVRGRALRISDRPPLIYHFDGKKGPGAVDAARLFDVYRASLSPDRKRLIERYRLADTAFKVVGVGSVGTFCAIGLFVSGDRAPLFLQVKQAQASALQRIPSAPRYRGPQGQRVIEGQRLMQAAPDIFLGWARDDVSKRDFYVRQLKNRRLGSIGEIVEEEALADYATLCGHTLARAHARSGEAALIAGYIGKSGVFDDAIASFALAYAKQTTLDHARLLAARPIQPAVRERA